MLVSSSGPTGFGPKLTDYRIGVSKNNGNTWETVHAGFCAAVGLESDRSSVVVSGVDWLAWLEQPYRFNAYNSPGRTAADVAKVWAMQGQQTIIDNLVANLWNGNASESVHITTAYEPAVWLDSIPAAYIIIGDNGSVLDHIKNTGSFNEPYGFEFWMDWNKVLTFASPRRTTYNNAVANSLGKFSPSEDNLIKASWSNTGPIATTTIGKGFGLISDPPSIYAPSIAVYRDWWNIREFGQNVKYKGLTTYQDFLQQITFSVGKHDRNPQKNLTITIQPEKFTGADFFRNRVGEVIQVDSENMFMPYHRINAYYWIDTQTLASDGVGNWTCTLKLEQAYDAVAMGANQSIG